MIKKTKEDKTIHMRLVITDYGYSFKFILQLEDDKTQEHTMLMPYNVSRAGLVHCLRFVANDLNKVSRGIQTKTPKP